MACASVSALLTGVGAAQAQTATTPPPVSPASPPATVPKAGVQEIVVTAQRRSENVQIVPIAVTALSSDALKSQRLDSAANLELTVPNLNFSQGAYGSANFQIRGIGFQIVSTAADSGVGVNENNAPLDRSRLAQSEFFDVSQVEVLRGPQGTLYGRNATGGAVDVITAKPVNHFDDSITVEAGNYGSYKATGFVNLPINDAFSLRIAGLALEHDGYQTNVANGDNIDGQKLYSTRATLAFRPNERFNAYFMWEHFQEDDSYDAGSKILCAQDPGPASVGGVAVTNAQARAYLSQGCLPVPLKSAATQTGVANSAASLGGQLTDLLGFTTGNVAAGSSQPNDPRGLNLTFDPRQHVRNDNYQFNMEWNVTDRLKLSSLTGYDEDHLIASAGSTPASTPFASTAITPGGVFNDPQEGPSAFLQDSTYNDLASRQWSEELRLQSSFSGPLNFNVGAFYFHIHRDDNTYIPSNGTTLYVAVAVPGAFIDPANPPTGAGHNYFNSQTPYQLNSYAGFGEVYYNFTDDLKLTLGFRYTDDQKSSTYIPLPFLSPGEGPLPGAFQQKADFKEPTGRVNLSWTPKLSFTNQSLFYASYSRGYKGGGFNTPDLTNSAAKTYDPEFVDAFEVGTKNTLLNHTLQLNLTGFYYKYTGYQYSTDIGLSVVTTNLNTTIAGAEFESIWAPVPNLAINANVGYLHTEVDSGANDMSVDPFDVTAGNPNLTALKSIGDTNCAGSTSGVAEFVGLVDAGILPAAALLTACPTAAAPNGAYAASGLTTTYGVAKNLTGNQLPTSPNWNVAIGGQYRFMFADWDLTPRVDFHYQSASFGDIYNDAWDKVPGWVNVNSTLTANVPSQRLQIQLYVKNLFNSASLTASAVDGSDVGDIRTAYYLDPRTYGISITKKF